MGSNSFGDSFKITTWGESHGPEIGVIIDGCPPQVNIDIEIINKALYLRAPGKNEFTSQRKEEDKAEIMSGVFNNTTTGAPISIIIKNLNIDSSKYESIKNVLRPGHANYTYTEKYGIFDYKGGGRSSARETACRVAAGSVAGQVLACKGIKANAYIKQIGNIKAHIEFTNIDDLRERTINSPVFCPDINASHEMQDLINNVKNSGDSLGGIVELIISSVPIGLGDPIYEKLDANLAKAMMSIPATKGFEIGSGFDSAYMLGSQNNDAFIQKNGIIDIATNNAGGILAGISSGQNIICRIAFKPTSSIKKPQQTTSYNGESCIFQIPEGSRHDPCVAIRGVPVVEAMANIVILNALMNDKKIKL